MFVKTIKKIFKTLKKIVSGLINSLLLLLVYFTAVALTSIFAKILGKKFLETKAKKSYWQEMKLNTKKEDYYRQF